MQPPRRTRLALLASLALHVGVLAWVCVGEAPGPTAPLASQSDPASPPDGLVWLSEPPSAPAADPVAQPPAPTAPKSAPAPRVRRPAKPEQPAPEDLAQAPREPSQGAPSHPADPEPHPPPEGPSAPAGSEPAPAPRRLTLLPQHLGPDPSSAPVAGDPHGHTLRNGDPLGPDADALAAYRAEEAQRKVQAWVEEDVASGRVGNGSYDAYFSRLGNALEKEAGAAPGLSNNPVLDLLKGWSAAGSRYGSTGTPYLAGEVAEVPRALDTLSPLEQASQRDFNEKGDGPTKRLRDRLVANAFARDFALGKMNAVLTAIVEIRQNVKGQHESTLLLASSGNSAFDHHVLEVAPVAVAKLAPAPDQGVGIHPTGLRTQWAFEGRLQFLSKPSELDAASVALNTALTVANALSNGGMPLDSNAIVDETTGETYVVDFTKAKLITKVRLLRVF